MTWDSGLTDWLMNSATMALRDRVQLVPPVAGRFGTFFNKKAVLTDNFEVSFRFRSAGARRTTKDGAFAFWITPDNFTASYNEMAIVKEGDWRKGMEKQDLTFAGGKASFNGLAMVFSSLNRVKRYRPSVTTMWGDGRRAMKLFEDAPLAEDSKRGNVQTHFVEWRNVGSTALDDSWCEVKIRARPGSLAGWIRLPPRKDFIELFRMPASIKKGSFIGFTAQTGDQGADASDEVSILGLETRNFDASVIGEEVNKNELQDEADWLKILEADKRYIDQKSQKEAVAKLTQMLQRHTERYGVIGHELKTGLAGVEERLTKLQTSIGVMRAEIKMPMEAGKHLEKVKTEIVGLRALFSKDKEHHAAKITEVHKVAGDLKASHAEGKGGVAFSKDKINSVSNQAKALEESVQAGSTQSSRMLLLLIFAVAGLGFLFLNRMRYYEKHHYI